MKRALVILAAVAMTLSACGGGAPKDGAAGGDGKGKAAPTGDFKKAMPEAMKPCDTANKGVGKALKNVKSGKVTANEARLLAEEALEVCEAANAAWRKLTLPEKATEPCLREADAKLATAQAQRVALDHQMSREYKRRIDRQIEAAKTATAECKEAVK